MSFRPGAFAGQPELTRNRPRVPEPPQESAKDRRNDCKYVVHAASDSLLIRIRLRDFILKPDIRAPLVLYLAP
jgi:hypothetical protein